ncbi:uncharacterized protein PG998_007948 [Apiospora kogelbergensis]|uniref:DUF8021 domain-containing protein n=1 Tax=Apiospora kogelbergensis TaxID=1337665 RepID=A0AAW0QD51_9PEZI
MFSGVTTTKALWALLSAACHVSRAAAQCSRDELLATANSYLEAQVSGKTDGLQISSTNFTYMENNKKADLAKGLLSQPLKLDLNRSTADTVACASYTMFITTTGTKPYVVGTQIRHQPGSANGTGATASITMIDTVRATTGDLFFNARQTLSYIQKEDWSPIADAARRPGRDVLRHAGDAYLDMWTDAAAAPSIPWGTDCERVEGSMLTRPCGQTLPRGGSAKVNGNRRYVIDEVMGSVDVLCEFSSLGAWPDSHEIRIVDGKVKYVHTITVMH